MTSTRREISTKALYTDTLQSTLGNDVVNLYVGQTRTQFTVHKDLICNVPWFKKAFLGGFKEQNGTMDMPEDSPEVVSLFVDWLYRGIVMRLNTLSHIKSLYGFYIFADKIREVELMDQIIDAIQDLHDTHHLLPPPRVFSHVFHHTDRTSKLRKWVLGLYIFGLKGLNQYRTAAIEKFRHAAIKDQSLFTDIFDMISKGDVQWRGGPYGRCTFHGHSPKERCYLLEKAPAISSYYRDV
ncbi:hypothetical protein HYFRA_00004553 [Hymenoscyphus fraxineus]|uniref:BTB domain-containing protein n=1 Tax=Hymenoscyphus fraxineus TaxID=746836 RepID=A0A9N9KXK2_9HELO|nr:hypothetical protein HYFRA_00004553 [Hymenoscyphus fraxineus]